MNTLRAKYKLIAVCLFMIAFFALGAVPMRAAAAGETFTWTGDKITASGGSFSADVFEPKTVIFTKDGAVYRSQQGFKQGSTILCYFKYTLTLTDNANGTLTGNGDDCPGQKRGDISMGAVTIGGAPSSGPTSVQKDACEQSADALGLLICGALTIVEKAVTWFDTAIINLLKIDNNAIFNTSLPSGKAFHTAWGIFRNIAYALLIIFGLIMVVSQIAGIEIFDAYTIKKMLPKLILAVIFVAVSWNMLHLAFDASNEAAGAIRDLIASPFSSINIGGVSDFTDFTTTFLIAQIISGAAVGGVIYLVVLGPGGVLALVATIGLFVFSAFILLTARTVVAYLLIISAPVAIICSAFEPFKKLFTLWRGLLITILLSLPAIAAIIELSHVGALIAYLADDQFSLLTAFAIFIAGYALIWTVFKKLDQVAGQLGNVLGGITGKMQQGLAKYRSNTAKRRWGEAMAGDSKRFGGVFGGLANTAAGFARRVQIAGQPGGSFFDKDKSLAADQGALFQAAAGMVETDAKKGAAGSGGNTEIMEGLSVAGVGDRATIAKRVEDFVVEGRRQKALSEGKTFTEEDETEARTFARTGVQRAEQNFGGTIGTREFTLAAAMATSNDHTAWREGNNGWTGEQAREAFRDSLAKLMDIGAIDMPTAAKILTNDKTRMDLAGGGFGAAMTYVNEGTAKSIAKATADGKSVREHLEESAEKYQASVTAGNSAQALYAQRWETARVEAKKMKENIRLMEGLALLDSGAPVERRKLDEYASVLGLAAGSSTGIIQAKLQEKLNKRKLLEDRSGKSLDSDKALSRLLAVADSVYQQVKYLAPQNAQQFSDFVLADEITVPYTETVMEEERTVDGRTIRRPVTRSGIRTVRVAEDITRRKQEDPEFPKYGYEIYGTASPSSPSRTTGGVDPRVLGGAPGAPGGPPIGPMPGGPPGGPPSPGAPGPL